MKHTIFFIAALMTVSVLRAQQVKDVEAQNVSIERSGDFLAVAMDFDLDSLDVRSNRAVLITPRVVNGTDSVELKSIGIYGRRRYYYYVRNGIGTLTGREEMNYRTKERPDSIDYRVLIPYTKWMDGAELRLHRADYGCCNEIVAEYDGRLARYFGPLEPERVYIRDLMAPDSLPKVRSLSGRSYIDFPVNKTKIYPEYRRNTIELAVINGTIDSVKQDKDITVDTIWLKGYASPESPYSNNRRLAIGRTEALKNYLHTIHKFTTETLITDYEPEDWEGLRNYVVNTNLANRDAILQLIDSDMEPDAKEARIKKLYPADYRHLLEHSYPALRHTDYRIVYTIRSYTDVNEMKRIMKTQPSKLSKGEFKMIAKTCEPGTREFTEVFEIAVLVYPDDPEINLNLASIALDRKDMKRAKACLDKAGDLPQAIYTRGAIAAQEGDFETALPLLREALSKNVTAAYDLIKAIELRMGK